MTSGGALAVQRGGQVTLQDVVIEGNKADVSGAGIFMHGTGSLHATATVVANNSCVCISDNCFVEGTQVAARGLDSVAFTGNSSIHLGSTNTSSSGILLNSISSISSLADPSGGATLDCLPGKFMEACSGQFNTTLLLANTAICCTSAS